MTDESVQVGRVTVPQVQLLHSPQRVLPQLYVKRGQVLLQLRQRGGAQQDRAGVPARSRAQIRPS